MDWCLAPLVLAGYLVTLHPNPSHVTTFEDALLDVQSCERGPGLDLKVSPSGIGSLMAQYGWHVRWGAWSLTASPKVGVGYTHEATVEQTSRANFSLGAQVLLGYEQLRLALDYWHLSNAGLGEMNAGLDLVSLTTGWAF